VRRTTALLCLLLLPLLPGPAAAQGRRVALVVGNGAYAATRPLANPANDAVLMAETLKGLGFALTGGRALTDLADKAAMEQAVQRFGQEVKGAEVALFFYAGHGVQVDGKNYLIPVRAQVDARTQVKYQLLDADYVLDEMAAAGTRVNVVILDACRNNPFGDRGLRDARAGLAQVLAPRGTLVAYSTAPGRTAADGGGRNSPYTAALARWLRTPGMRLDDVFMKVGVDVEQATGGEQSPWKSDNLRGVFCLAGPCGKPQRPKPAGAPAYAPLGEALAVQPGDAGWPLGPVTTTAHAYVVARDAAVKTPGGGGAFRVDYDFTQGPERGMACVLSRERRDASAVRGVEFRIRATEPVTGYLTINTAHPERPREVDRFYASFRVDKAWRLVRLPFAALAVSTSWRESWAAQAGLVPGDGVMRPGRMQEIRIGLDPRHAPKSKGSFWVGDLRFFR
jgi:hypothetical protein